jgi:Family of unknown function (DUF6196)
MYINEESADKTHLRLMHVIATADFIVHDMPYAFVECDVAHFPGMHVPQALAFVRDENVWSALLPSSSADQEAFVIFGFHFTPGLDNSGFVGWLASHLKSKLGTGVLVICGQNSQRGGIFDYWGAPISIADQVIAEIVALRSGN